MLIDQYISFSEEGCNSVLLMLSFTWQAVYQPLIESVSDCSRLQFLGDAKDKCLEYVIVPHKSLTNALKQKPQNRSPESTS
jgi:hypothetical protein